MKTARGTREVLKYLLSFSVAAVLVYFSFRGVKWNDFVAGLSSCRWFFVLISMAAGILAFWFRALRWKSLIVPVEPQVKMRTVFNAVNIGYVANFVFPRIGEFVRCGVVSGNSFGKASYDKVLGTVVLERVWDMITMVVFVLVLLVFRGDRFGAFFMDDILAPAAGRFSVGLWWAVAAVCLIAAAALYALWRFRDRNPIFRKIHAFFAGIVQGVGTFLKMKDKWTFLFYTAVIWGLYWMMSYTTMRALPDLDSLGLIDSMFLMLAGSLGWVVPVPGGFGAFHYIVALALSVIYGVPWELGIVFATLSHESQAITMALCGTLSYMDEALFRKRGRKIRN